MNPPHKGLPESLKVIINICRVQVSSEPSTYANVCFLFNNTLQQSPLTKTSQHLSSLAAIQPTGGGRWCRVHKACLLNCDQALS